MLMMIVVMIVNYKLILYKAYYCYFQFSSPLFSAVTLG